MDGGRGFKVSSGGGDGALLILISCCPLCFQKATHLLKSEKFNLIVERYTCCVLAETCIRRQTLCPRKFWKKQPPPPPPIMTRMPTRFSGGQPATPCMHTAYSAIKTMLPQTDIPQTRTPPHISSPLSNKNISMVMGQIFLTHIHGPSQTWLAGVIIWN